MFYIGLLYTCYLNTQQVQSMKVQNVVCLASRPITAHTLSLSQEGETNREIFFDVGYSLLRRSTSTQDGAVARPAWCVR